MSEIEGLDWKNFRWTRGMLVVSAADRLFRDRQSPEEVVAFLTRQARNLREEDGDGAQEEEARL